MTSLEWLVEQMIYQMDIRIENTTTGYELLEQAKEMEKEQIMNAWNDVGTDGITTAEQYYNQTYKSE